MYRSKLQKNIPSCLVFGFHHDRWLCVRIWPNLALLICGAPRYRICRSSFDRHTKFRPSVGQVLSSQAMMRQRGSMLRLCVLIINYPSGSTCMSLGLPSRLSSWSACRRRVSRVSKLSLCNNSSHRAQPTGQPFHCFVVRSILIFISSQLGARNPRPSSP